MRRVRERGGQGRLEMQHVFSQPMVEKVLSNLVGVGHRQVNSAEGRESNAGCRTLTTFVASGMVMSHFLQFLKCTTGRSGSMLCAPDNTKRKHPNSNQHECGARL